MKTKNIAVVAAVLAVACVVNWTVAFHSAKQAETLEHPSFVVQPIEPVVVTPATPFDLEVCSPTDIHEDQSADPAVDIEMPTPDLTWYDPNGLDEVGNIG